MPLRVIRKLTHHLHRPRFPALVILCHNLYPQLHLRNLTMSYLCIPSDDPRSRSSGANPRAPLARNAKYHKGPAPGPIHVEWANSFHHVNCSIIPSIRRSLRENTGKIDEQRLRIGTYRGGLEYNLKFRWEITPLLILMPAVGYAGMCFAGLLVCGTGLVRWIVLR